MGWLSPNKTDVLLEGTSSVLGSGNTPRLAGVALNPHPHPTASVRSFGICLGSLFMSGSQQGPGVHINSCGPSQGKNDLAVVGHALATSWQVGLLPLRRVQKLRTGAKMPLRTCHEGVLSSVQHAGDYP